MFRYIKVNQKGLLLVLLPLIFELVFVAVLAQRLASTAQEFDQLTFSQRALYKLFTRSQQILAYSFQIASFQTTASEKRAQAAQNLIDMFSEAGFTGDWEVDKQPELRDLFAEVDSNRRAIIRLARRVKDNSGATPIGMLTNKDRDETIITLLTFRSLFDRVKSYANRVDFEESNEFNRMSAQVNAFLVGGFIISSGLSLLVASVVMFDIVRRLRIISHNAYLVAAGRESREPQAGTDEIAELDRALHKTSLQLQASRKKELVILNNTADVVCSLDKQLRFVIAGESSERIWGWASDDLVGRSLISIIGSDTADDAIAKFESVAKSTQTVEIETAVKCKNGTLKDALWRVNWSNEVQQHVCVVHDVTELKKIERLKQAFFSMVSHDLRAPLTSININLANMTSGHLGTMPDGSEKILNSAIASTQRLTSLVNDLLELDKLDSGKLSLDLECISVRDVCESSIANLESLASAADVEIKGPSGDAAVLADEMRLVQAITNLLSNALKFSPAGSTVTVAIRRDENQVEIAVSDQGPGIPLDQQSLLFEKYAQGSAVSNVALKSTGLGLAIVKSIIKAHDGKVGIESESGKGATFWVRLKEFTEDGDRNETI
jgi:PAS domain S-box